MSKFTCLLLLFGMFSFSSVSGQAQKGISVKLLFVDSLIKAKKYRETGFQLQLINSTEENVYIPHALNLFSDQINDSLFIFKLNKKNNVFVGFLATSGQKLNSVGGNSVYYGPTSYKLNQYFSQYLLKKKLSNEIVNSDESMKNQGSSNSLLLKSGEAFILYHIVPIDYLYSREGYYKIFLKFDRKISKGFPTVINGYQRFQIDRVQTEAIFINVKKNNNFTQVVVKDSDGRKLDQFQIPTVNRK